MSATRKVKSPPRCPARAPRRERSVRFRGERAGPASPEVTRVCPGGLRCYGTTFDLAAVGMAQTSLDGDILRVNRQCCALLGYAPEELVGRSLRSITQSADPETALFTPQADGDRVKEAEQRYIRKDGSSLWVHVKISLAGPAADEAPYLIVVMEDIGARKRAEEALHNAYAQLESRVQARTAELMRLNATLKDEIAERRRVERKLRESEARARAVVDNMPEGLVMLNARLRIESFNPAAERIFGAPAEAALGCCLGDYLAPESREAYLAHVAELRHGDAEFDSRTAQLNGLRAGGGTFPMELELCRVSVGDAVAFSGMVRDVSERRRAEEELLDSKARLHRLSAHLQAVREEESTKIAREIHDELGGTLTVMKLGLTSLMNRTGESDWVHQKAASLLTLADAAIQTVRRISTSLRPGMLDTLGLMATIKWHTAEFSQVTGIRSELQLPEYIRLTPERSTAVYRIIQEALTNVARHSLASRVRISVAKARGHLVVEIQDDGRGIGAAGLSKPNSYGILGMRERCQYLGGALSIGDAPDAGTLVKLTLPLSDRGDAREA